MAQRVSEWDAFLVGKMVEFGVLKEVQKHQLKPSRGDIFLICADGSGGRFRDNYQYLTQLRKELGHPDHPFHPLTGNGRPVGIAEDSPLFVRYGFTPEEVREVFEAYGFDNAVNLPHLPCLAEIKFGWDAKDVLDKGFKGKLRLKHFEALGGAVTVSCYLQTDYGIVDDRRKIRTRFADRANWDEFLRCYELDLAPQRSHFSHY